MSARKSKYEYEPCTYRNLGKGVDGFIHWCNDICQIQYDAILKVKAKQEAEGNVLTATPASQALGIIQAAAQVAKNKRLGKSK
ncbi:hypothetical protein [Hydrogenophaga sp.]|uniref:hypothetical protein n=1 Tax=Hydrogenophaga sp. TaxID=1904254 RepID=UPI0025C6EF55|nr:hypothetical protein [Hydrogenophaga sp.]